MACLINKGRLEPCKDSVGGITAVYFIDFGDLGDPTYATDSDEITAFSEATINAYKYVVKGNSSLEQTVTSSRENGTTFYDQIVNLTFKKTFTTITRSTCFNRRCSSTRNRGRQ